MTHVPEKNLRAYLLRVIIAYYPRLRLISYAQRKNTQRVEVNQHARRRRCVNRRHLSIRLPGAWLRTLIQAFIHNCKYQNMSKSQLRRLAANQSAVIEMK